MSESETGEFHPIPPRTPLPDRQIKEPDPFQERLDAILMRQLTPENINTYATDAIDQVVGLVDNVVSSYHPKETEVHKTDLERENAAFHHYGLPDINNILDHIQTVSEELSTIDDVIAHIPKANEIYVPPDDVTVASPQGTGTEPIAEKRVIPRLKTLLFVVSQDYDTDIRDPQQVSISPGAVHEQMMRKEGYVLVDIPGIQRASLVCDEEGNVTYVFNTQELTSLDKTPEDMATFSKSEINNFLEEHPAAGQRIVYSDLFVKNLGAALETPHYVVNGGNGNTPSAADTTSPADRSANYLYPKAPEGYISARKLARSFGVDHRTVESAISALKDELGDIREAKFGPTPARALSPDQQKLIRQHLDREGHLVGKPPEGFESVPALAQLFGVNPRTVESAISALKDELGDIREAKYGSQVGRALSPEQQNRIKEHLERRGNLTEKPPEGFESVPALAQLFGVNPRTVESAISALKDELGDIREAKYGSQVGKALSPEQQNRIKEHLERRGNLTEKPPEGFESVPALAQLFGVNPRTVESAISALKDELGDIREAKYGSQVGKALSPEQQELIRQHLEHRGNLTEKAPEGFESLHGLAQIFGLYDSAVESTITALKGELGDIKTAKFGTVYTLAFSPEQQELIRQHLERNGKFTDKAPEGYLSLRSIATDIGIGNSRLKHIIDSLGSQLGPPIKAKFHSRPTSAYSPEQVEMIKRAYEDRNK